MGFVVGLLFRLAALAVVLWAAVIPLSLFILRAREGLHEEKVYEYAAIGSALLVFPALIFLGWWDAAVGSIIPLIMLAIIMATLENTDPEYTVPKVDALKGKTALVVGGSRGIGLAVVQEYVRQGAQVVVANRQPFDASLVNVTGSGQLLGDVVVDLTDGASIASFADRLTAGVSGAAQLDVIVLNGGVFCPPELTTATGLETVAAVNFVGVGRLVQALLPRLVSGGAVLFSGSASSRQWEGSSEQLTDLHTTLAAGGETGVDRLQSCMQRYARSKALVDGLAMELATLHPTHRFHVVFPNPTNTDMLRTGMEDLARLVRYPAFFSPGTRLFDEFNQFWVSALSRSVERVAVQYVYGALSNTSLESNGCMYFGERCLRPQPYELALVGSTVALLGSAE